MIDWADRFVPRAASLGSFAVPLALGVLAASPEPYWLDSPEFTAAAQTLGIPHPPGHPLYVMLVKPLTLLPLGGISFRVAIASALFGGVACLLLYHLILTLTAAAAPQLPRWSRSMIAFTAALLAAVAPGWWSRSCGWPRAGFQSRGQNRPLTSCNGFNTSWIIIQV